MKQDKVSSGLHLDIPGKITATYLELPRSLDYDECAEILIQLAQVHDASNFWLGDCINHIEEVHGEKFAQAVSDANISEERALALKYVSSHISKAARARSLSWSYHRELAKLEKPEQVKWLTACSKKDWSLQQLKDELTASGLRNSKPRKENIPFDPNVIPYLKLPPNGPDPSALAIGLSECNSCGAEGAMTVTLCKKCFQLLQLIERKEFQNG